MPYPFRFGRCVNPTFGLQTFDMLDLPHVQADIQETITAVGGGDRALDGTYYADRIAEKSAWQVSLAPWMSMQNWWPVLRLWKGTAGPWLWFNQTAPNLLSGAARLMANWTTAARIDGAVPLADGGQVTMTDLAAPIQPGLQVWCGASVYGPSQWTATVSVLWIDGTGATLSTAAVGTFTKASLTGQVKVLDGSVSATRCGAAVTAPAGAVGARLRVAVVNAAADVSDPVIVPGPADPGAAMVLVAADAPTLVHHMPGLASLSLTLMEV